MNGYQSRQLLNDIAFEKGFCIVSQEKENNSQIKLGSFVGNEAAEPLWNIVQWDSGSCLWNERVHSDPNIITDGSTKWVIYKPDEGSVEMRLNAANVYGGYPAGNEAWPHLLLEQSPIRDYSELSQADKAFYNCSADRIIVNLDIRINEFKETTNPDGINAVQYLAYFYMSDKNGNNFIWFGLNLFDSRGYQDEYWALDKASNCMIYSVSTKDTFCAKNKSLFRNGQPYISSDWTTVQLDIKPYIEKAINTPTNPTHSEKQ